MSIGASPSALPVYTCPKVAVAPVIDGKLDDAAWKCTPEVEFVNTVNGQPVKWTTKARMCYDDANLYVAFDCVDEDIWGTMFKRDEPLYEEEVAEIFLCPDRDLRHYYELEVSPHNVIWDGYIVNKTGSGPGEGSKVDWTCEGMRTAVVVDGTLDNRNDVDRGWTVEMAIPFASIGRQTPRQCERWRVNLYRINRTPAPLEFQAWSPTLRDPAAFHVPDRFGTVFFSEI